jgi:hypothetical protein
VTTRTTWEYMILVPPGRRDGACWFPDGTTDSLMGGRWPYVEVLAINDLGKDGWELAGVARNALYFKRPVGR